MKIITIGSIKGGTGKTSVLVLLARLLACNADRVNGKKILLIDLDINDSLSSVIKSRKSRELDIIGNKHIAAALLSVKDDFDDYILPSRYPNIDILQSHLQLSRVNFTQNLLKNKIKTAGLEHKYDHIMIDTPATYYALHIMAYEAADLIITPVNPSKFDFHPLQQLLINLREDTNKSDNWKLFYNRVKPDNQVQNDYFDMFKKKFEGRIYNDVKIPDTVKVKECIDRNILVGRKKEHAKLRKSLCTLAQQAIGVNIDSDMVEGF